MISSGNQAYQPVGNLVLDFPGHMAANYYGELDLKTAIAKVTYTYNGVSYTREYFASYPDQVIIVRLTADQPGKITYTAGMNTPHAPGSVTVAGNISNDPQLVNLYYQFGRTGWQNRLIFRNVPHR